MPKQRKLPPHLWKPGQSGNPGARKPIEDEDLKATKNLSADEIKKMIAKVSRMSLNEVADIALNPHSKVLEALFARIAIEAIKKGDHQRMSFLFDRSIGKVMEKHVHEMKPVVYNVAIDDTGTLVQDVLDEELSDIIPDS